MLSPPRTGKRGSFPPWEQSKTKFRVRHHSQAQNVKGTKTINNLDKQHFKAVFFKMQMNMKKIHDQQNTRILDKDRISNSAKPSHNRPCSKRKNMRPIYIFNVVFKW